MPKSTLFGHFRIRQITLCLHWSGSCQKCHFRSQKVALKRGFFVSSVITIHGNQFSASLGHVFFWALFGPFWTPGGVQMDPWMGSFFTHWTRPMGFLDHFVESNAGYFTRVWPTGHRFGLIWKNWSFSRIYTIGIGGYPQPGEKSTLFSLQR